MERALQILDELDDVAAFLNLAWMRLAVRGAGLASLLAVSLVFFLPF